MGEWYQVVPSVTLKILKQFCVDTEVIQKVCVGEWYQVVPSVILKILILFCVDIEVIRLYGSEFEFDLKLTAR